MRIRLVGALLLVWPIISCLKQGFRCLFAQKQKEWIDVVMDIKDLDSNANTVQEKDSKKLTELYQKYGIEKDII